MQTIKDLLNKIKWDKRENPEDYTIGYYDRLANKIITIDFKEIASIEDGFMLLDRIDETWIPLHRVRIVKKKGTIIWERKVQNDTITRL